MDRLVRLQSRLRGRVWQKIVGGAQSRNESKPRSTGQLDRVLGDILPLYLKWHKILLSAKRINQNRNECPSTHVHHFPGIQSVPHRPMCILDMHANAPIFWRTFQTI
jgi:hypothetical protein